MYGIDYEINKIKRKFFRTLWLFCLIASGVATGNIISTAIIAKSISSELEKATKKLNEEHLSLNKEPGRIQRSAELEQVRLEKDIKQQQQKIINEIQKNTQANIPQKNNANGIDYVKKQRDATCDFWINTYNKSKHESDKSHRDVACRDAGRPFN